MMLQDRKVFLPAICLVMTIVTVAEAQGLNEAREAVERSPFTAEEKTAIMTAAGNASAAGVPEADAAIIVTRGIERGADGPRIAEFLRASSSLQEQGLPARMVLDRVEQGFAKGVPAERIASSVEKLSGMIREARPVVESLELENRSGKAGTDEAIETVARALERSVPAGEITKTGETVREHGGSLALFNRAVETATTFAGNGMNAADASRMVRDAIGRGYTGRDLEAMERYMVDQRRRNRSVEDIVSGMETRMEFNGMRGGADRRTGGMRGGPGAGSMGGRTGMGGRR